MERETVGLDPVPAPEPSGPPACSLASLRRRAWAKSRESTWQETQKPESSSPVQPQPNCRGTDVDSQRTSEEPGLSPNKITSWLDQCRTPLAVSLDDQSASPSKGALRNGCSFEDDLSLGAEADHLQSSNKKTGSCGGLAANQKRSQYKEKGRSMNSTGSGKSSTVSSVSELLDLYEEDPEEILLNLGFGRDEPDMSSRIPSRFFDSSSSARGIDIKVYLGAQLQRMEVENPDFALTSRFRQIEVLTTVANQFIQLYGHVSGQPVQSVSSKDQGGEGGGNGVKEESPPPLKRRNSALNAAKLLKKTLTKHNLLTPSPELSATRASNQPANKGQPDDDLAKSHTNNGPAQDSDTAEHDHHADSANQKHVRKKDSCSLATVTEETNGDGESERLTEDSPELNSKHQPESPDSQPANQRADEQTTKVDEMNIISTTDKAPPSLALPQLLHLRIEKADSFDMEEILSNEDEALLSRRSMKSDLLRTASQHSDSSGFAEEPSVDSSNLKVQESSDSCDSETTVTSHPSQDVSTPIALDQPVFVLPECNAEVAEPISASEAVGNSQEEDECDGNSEQVPQYTAHQLPKNCPQDETQDVEQDGSNLVPESEPEQSQNQEKAAVGTEPSQQAADGAQVDPSCSLPASNSPILNALSRAKQRLGSHSSDRRPVTSRRRLRGGHPLHRSSSLPSSLLSPSKVVSSVKIEFGQGQTSCSQPRYAFRYIQEPTGDQETTASSTCISTLVINHSSKSTNQSALLAEDCAPPKLTPRHLIHSSCSLRRCASPPVDWPAARSAQPRITQSVPDLSSNQEQFGRFQQGMTPDQSVMFLSPSPSPSPNLRQETPLSAPHINPSFLYPTPFHPYASLPNLHHPHHSSMPSLLPQPTNISHLHPLHPPAMVTPPQYTSLWNLHPGTPTLHHFHPNSYQLYHSAPHTPPYLGSHGYDINQDHILHRGSAPPGPGFLPGPGLGLGPHPGLIPGLGPHPGLSPSSSQVLSSTEMQLRRVLHDIRGTVQRLNQNQDETSDVFTEHRASSQQSLADLQQKRRNLSLFRTQMMDLELSIIRQQALVYKHLSPADRLEVEHLQSLRSAVRDELLELEQQLEDKVMELTHNGPSKGLYGYSSIENLCTTSTLKAMEPVSDLLREQYLLQSQLSCDDNAPSTASSSPPTSHTLSGAVEQRPGVYRASINITPAPPPRPIRQAEVEEDTEEGTVALGGGKEIPQDEEEVQDAGVKGENLQDLIREIRESVAQEVRREIFNELMAAVSPRQSPLPAARQ
uniref:protein ITPRID2 isoform X2 n=1 Tax=Doryrhamphus excisus TaxID=161450 RepID=UPI0025ADA35B|nr:protein ITPRID2 isoform X2 [Doryrhamphus excisus]